MDAKELRGKSAAELTDELLKMRNHQMGPLTSVTVEPAWGFWPTFRDRVGPVRRVAAGFLIIYL